MRLVRSARQRHFYLRYSVQNRTVINDLRVAAGHRWGSTGVNPQLFWHKCLMPSRHDRSHNRVQEEGSADKSDMIESCSRREAVRQILPHYSSRQ